jgi:hypothetical protein
MAEPKQERVNIADRQSPIAHPDLQAVERPKIEMAKRNTEAGEVEAINRRERKETQR